MRFDDTLGTVLAADLTTPASAQAAWRQVVDLIGRGRAPADGDVLSMLERIRRDVPVAVRAASARALSGAHPPAALVRLLALDDAAVATPILRSALLPAEDWIALLPALSPTARAVLRHRRDLPPAVVRALESFGPVDFVIGSDTPQDACVVVSAPDPVPVDTAPFVSVGAIALGLPLVAEALRRGNDNEPPAGDGGTFRIADVVARLEAFQRRKDQAPPPPAPVPPTIETFRFETDPAGVIRWVEGAARGALIGVGLARPARPAQPGVDGVASGAFRRRARFTDARLVVGGGDAGGIWLISAVPLFDPASGRFIGYRGAGRRKRRHEHAGPATADALRQLVHELRTPAGAIAGFSEMIEHEVLGPVAPPLRAQAAHMRGDVGSLLAAIDDLDTAARIDAGAFRLKAEPIALTPLFAQVADALAPLITARGARLVLPDAAGTVLADARALERLVTRLLGAMIAAATAGETITIRAFDGADSRIGLAVTRPAALDTHPGEAVLTLDDDDSPASLLGAGFALRLARNLARELGGALIIGQRHLTLYLPAAADHAGYRVRAS